MNTAEMLAELNDFASIVSFDKALLAAYAANESIPLDERWDTWCKAPNVLKNFSGYYISLPGIDDDKIHMHCQDRFRVFDVAEMIQSLEDDEQESKENIDKAKADILRRNIGSFEYDW